MTPALRARQTAIEKHQAQFKTRALSPAYALMGGVIVLSLFGALALFAIAR